MKLYYNKKVYQNAQNTVYPDVKEIRDDIDLREVAAWDHMTAGCKNGYRNNKNFQKCDCLAMDVDNCTFTGKYTTTGDIEKDLPGVEFYAVTSRNHKRERTHNGKKYPAAPRFHVYFPIKETKSAAKIAEMKAKLVELFPYYDDNAKDAVRFFYGNKDAKCIYCPGKIRLDEWLKDPAPKEQEAPAADRDGKEDPRLLDALQHIPVGQTTYNEWLKVGQALKSGGYDVSVWDEWSVNDARYKAGECAKKWAGFDDPTSDAAADFKGSVTEATIFYLAKSFGWKDPGKDPGDDPKQEESKLINASDFMQSGVYTADIEYFKSYKDRKIGFPDIDKYLTLYPGLACLGGASSLGKTTFAVNIADKLLARGETVLYFSLEQMPVEIVTKSLARMIYENNPFSQITNNEIKGDAKSPELERAKQDYAELAKRLYIIPGDFRMTAGRIVKIVESFIQEHKVKPIVIIDYLQLIARPQDVKGDRREYIDENIKALKLMQKNNELFVLLISSFNRSSSLQPVSYESFKETGMIEYTCDYIWGLQLSVQDAENTTFYTVRGPKGGLSQRTDWGKQQLINREQKKLPKQVEFVSLKNRNGTQFFKAFFDYFPKYDAFTPTNDFKVEADEDQEDFDDF